MANFLEKLIGRISSGKKNPDNQQGPLAHSNARDEERDEDEALLAAAQRVFLRYNTEKTDFLYSQLPSRKRLVFDLVPLLIHLSAEDLLGAPEACRQAPCGLFGFTSTDRVSQAFATAFPGRDIPTLHPMSAYDVAGNPIKSLALMGSLGSIAQTAKSDFDYWIVYEDRDMDEEKLTTFRTKMGLIEKWAESTAGAEVHFFPLAISRLRVHDFGHASGESSGTAQAKLLKEEFYRTMTLVAGQMPLWWIMPPGVSDDEYLRLSEVAERAHRVDEHLLIDMGNVWDISFGEFYGAAIWQLNKTVGSPFKSVLKMALLEEYVVDHGTKGLLCHELKRRLLANEKDIALLDPYLLMFDRAARYLQEQGRTEDLDLLRRSLYLKAGVGLTLSDYRKANLPRRKRVMVGLVREWGWNHGMVEKLNQHHNWSFHESMTFSQEINRFIVRTYRRLSAEIARQKDQSGLVISQRDLTLLGRKLYIFYSKRTNKVESIKNVIEEPPALDSVTIQSHQDKHGSKVWAAYRALLSWDSVSEGSGAASLLKSTRHLAELLLWLVHNQLYSNDTTINLNSGRGRLATYCTVPDLQALLREMQGFFLSYKYANIQEDDLLRKPRITRMLLVMNLEEPDTTRNIVDTGLCYQNNWGELFFRGYKNDSEGLQLTRNFIRKNYTYDPFSVTSSLHVFIPNREFRRDLVAKLNKIFGMKVVA